MTDPFVFCDELGPAKVVHLHRPAARLQAVVVVDNVALGPAIGGIRMAPDATAAECFRLARAMTFKNAAANLAHGGAKSVIVADPAMPLAEKERLLRAFACAIAELVDYIPGPDMGTDERCMGWVHDEIGRGIGLPAEFGGIPLDQIGATGFGVTIACEVACRHTGIALRDARVVLEGFGAVGRNAARFLAERGARIVAVADIGGAVHAAEGLDVDALRAHAATGASVGTFDGGRRIGHDELIAVPCEIWIPAARPDTIHIGNAQRMRARMVVPGANVPATEEGEAILHEMGVLVVPDFIANAGGVICGTVEHRGGTAAQALTLIETRIRANAEEVLHRAKMRRTRPRAAAMGIARERIDRAMALRRWR